MLNTGIAERPNLWYDLLAKKAGTDSGKQALRNKPRWAFLIEPRAKQEKTFGAHGDFTAKKGARLTPCPGSAPAPAG